MKHIIKMDYLAILAFCCLSVSFVSATPIMGPQGETIIGLGKINKVAVSPEGDYVASAGNLGLFVWDGHTGQLIDSFLDDPDPIAQVMFSLDGTQLIFCSMTTLYKWNFVTDHTVTSRSSIDNHASFPLYSPDGSRVVQIVQGADSFDRIEIRNAFNGELLVTLEDSIAPGMSMVFLPDDRFMASTAQHMGIVWDLKTGKIVDRFGGFKWGITSLAYSPDGRNALIGTQREGSFLWDLERNKLLFKFDHSGPQWDRGNMPAHVAFDSQNDFFVTNSDIWRGEMIDRNYQLDREGSIHLQTGQVYALDVLSDRDWVFLSSSYKHSAMIFDASANEFVLEIDVPHTPLSSAAFFPGGDRIVLGAQDGVLMVLNVETQSIEREWIAHEGSINAIDFSYEGDRFATVGNDGRTAFWDAETLEQFDTLQGESAINSVQFSHVKGVALIADASGYTILVDADEDEVRAVFPGTQAVFSPDEKSILIAGDSDDGNVRVWDIASHTQRFALDNTPMDKFTLMPDGKSFIAIDRNNRLVRMDCETRVVLTYYSLDTPLANPVQHFTTDGNVVLATNEGTVYRWNALSGTFLQTISAHETSIEDIVLLNDNQHFLSYTQSSIKKWKIGDDMPVMEFNGHTGDVQCADYDPSTNLAIMGLIGSETSILRVNLEGDSPIHAYPVGEGQIDTLAIHPNGTHVVYALNDHSIPVLCKLISLDLTSGISSDLLLSEKSFYKVKYSPSGKLLYVSTWEGQFFFKDNHEPRKIDAISIIGTFSVDFSNDETSFFLTGDDDGTTKTADVILEYDVESGKVKRRYEISEEVQGLYLLSISSNGGIMAVSNQDTIYLLNRQSGELLHRIATEERAFLLKFSPNSQFLLVDAGREIVLYDVDTGERLQVFSSHKDSNALVGTIKYAGFKDDSHIVTIGEDGSSRIWTIRDTNVDDWSVY